MNREMRRMMERDERRQKRQQSDTSVSGRAAAAANRRGKAAGDRQPLIRRVIRFLHDVRIEMRKVSWPTREQLIAFTAVTLITSVALTLLVFGMDFGLKELVLFAVGGANG